MQARILTMVAVAMFATACGKTDAPRPAASVAPMKPIDSPAIPTTPMPKVAADANPVPGPTPGQANDHSSPAFKAGGPPDPKK